MSSASDSSDRSLLPAIQLNKWRQRAAAQGFTTGKAGSLNKPKFVPGKRRDAVDKPAFTGSEPAKISGIFDRLLTERGWEEPVAVGSVLTRWPELVGPEIAEHCTAESFTDTTLVIRTASTEWATQLTMMRFALLQHLTDRLGENIVTELKILGPYQNRWGKGPQWVKGRGPRDTYG
ncbi:DUF721 domain-containing protein [Micrococcoides hystricis]|uniref:DUF721 domain-containing protein n=1 Tax=Micrococcoides hystricis TaxID=1572761 RepID=A0ABV6PBL2_9MICC